MGMMDASRWRVGRQADLRSLLKKPDTDLLCDIISRAAERLMEMDVSNLVVAKFSITSRNG